MTDLQRAAFPDAASEAPQRRRWAFLTTRGWIGAIAGALLFAVACFAVLTPWQLDRNSDRSELNAAITAAADAPAVPVTDLMSTTAQPSPEALWHPVSATGRYLPDDTVYVRLRQDAAGSPVSEVVVPFRLEDGTVLMVDRGYVAAGALDATAPAPAGRVTITGRVQADQNDPRNRLPVVQGGVLQAWAINGFELAAATDTAGPVLGGYIQLVEGAPGVLDPVGVPQIDSGPFLSYALQWVVFGVVAAAGMAFFIYREAVDPRDESYPQEEDEGQDDAPQGDRQPRESRESRTSSARAPDPTHRTETASAPPDPTSRRSRRFDRSELYDD